MTDGENRKTNRLSLGGDRSSAPIGCLRGTFDGSRSSVLEGRQLYRTAIIDRIHNAILLSCTGLANRWSPISLMLIALSWNQCTRDFSCARAICTYSDRSRLTDEDDHSAYNQEFVVSAARQASFVPCALVNRRTNRSIL